MNNSKTQNYYDDFSSWYEKERHHGYHSMIDALHAQVLGEFVSGQDVLEVGCGTGLILDRIRHEARSLTGIDLSRGMLQPAAQRELNVMQGEAYQLPFADKSFDVAYSFKVLAHVQPISEALAEMSRVLRPGGHLIADFYNVESIRYLAKRLGGPKKISETKTEAEVFTRWDRPEAVRGYLPDDVKFLGWRGVRVLTPAAFVHRIPLAGRLISRAEELTLRSPLARFGGFLVAVCQKK